MRESEEPQTEAIDEDPFEDSTSDTRRSVYWKSSPWGSTGLTAFSARAPWPISRRRGPRMNPASPVEKGGKL